MNPIVNNVRVTDAAGKDSAKIRSLIQPENAAAQVNFRNVLDSALGQVQFSKHAALRLNDRNINLTSEQMERVAGGIHKADEKGIRDSLVLVDNLALVINVKSRTVITAMSQNNENVFNHIDGAVIV